MRLVNHSILICLISSFTCLTQSIAQDSGSNNGNSQKSADQRTPNKAAKWKMLFDGARLGQWKSTNFGGEGEVEIIEKALVLNAGDPLTGVTWQDEKSIPKSNYEIELQAQRTQGIDFFCGLTFPVKKDHCTFVVAGWAGAIVGLSNIDGFDASENATTQYMSFKDNTWYTIRVRVTDDDIQCWIDDKRVVNQYLEEKKISTRPEVLASRPLGISCYQSTAHLRKIRIRELNKEELKKAGDKKDK